MLIRGLSQKVVDFLKARKVDTRSCLNFVEILFLFQHFECINEKQNQKELF